LHAALAASGAQVRGGDMVVSVRRQQRKCGKSLHDLITRSRADETLKQLLEHEPGREHALARLQRPDERADFGRLGWPVAAEQ
jgi:hypothetical protein